MTIFYVLIAVVAIAVFALIGIYNKLITLRNRAKEALSDIDVQTKRRYDLIPNLVETVKGYMGHERSVLENVTNARTAAMAVTGNPLEKAKNENALAGTLKTLFAVSENYPDLKANVNFLELQRELEDTENKIMASRRFYNSTVNDLNTKVQSFPANIVAGMFGFTEEKFFEATSEAERQPVKVSF
ncbi:MAG: LemA family protein [bacterium]|nr:LemA family protein [bacterium]